ncbi:adenosylcobinamide-phosphate synthase CbiB [Allorhodopirellula heiligendammensis]|uniref:Cobalamin biosynthesis protein CobD n=1 Tax=Allorhodopirellula heiligendammensis TaxID=2714739 RepID=A0A5C6BWX4_9BACT|nr:adenosylcobinamide-phosphate synthase CbiB [Allorhodopirellula heiligendammensis]TWU15294.1 cobalamin biosynthesis protein [Allorhodopirellula heiligendammensis]
MLNYAWTPAVILIAVTLDVAFGEPPNRWHPVAWMGSLISWWNRVWDSRFANVKKAAGRADHRCGEFLCGCGIVVVGAVLCGMLGWVVQANANGGLGVLIQAMVLKCCFGFRSLQDAARSVATELLDKNLFKAREQLAFHLVSRDVSELSAAEVSAATIESVAENTSDSVIAPLLFFVVAGLPGALIYRFINTCDAMLGYRTERLEWLGKPAARLDDVLNVLPARITALLMVAASVGHGDRVRAWKTWRSDARATASPNAGQPMSAAAGSLGVCLEKRSHYRIGSQFPPPAAPDIERMITLYQRTIVLAVTLTCLSGYLIHWCTGLGNQP